MSSAVLVEAVRRLRAHYGPQRPPGAAGDWPTVVRVVLEHGRAPQRSDDWSWVEDGALVDARETAQSQVARIEEILETAGQPVKKAPLLRKLAEWWQRHAGDKSAPDFRQRRLADWQAELRAVRGVSWELADRILLFAGRLPVYPLDRGSMRIAARHGWIDLTAEYDDWQAFFVHRDGEFDLREVALWNTLVARGFCGRQPDCDHCPLRACLPERGPVSLEFDE